MHPARPAAALLSLLLALQPAALAPASAAVRSFKLHWELPCSFTYPDGAGYETAISDHQCDFILSRLPVSAVEGFNTEQLAVQRDRLAKLTKDADEALRTYQAKKGDLLKRTDPRSDALSALSGNAKVQRHLKDIEELRTQKHELPAPFGYGKTHLEPKAYLGLRDFDAQIATIEASVAAETRRLTEKDRRTVRQTLARLKDDEKGKMKVLSGFVAKNKGRYADTSEIFLGRQRSGDPAAHFDKRAANASYVGALSAARPVGAVKTKYAENGAPLAGGPGGSPGRGAAPGPEFEGRPVREGDMFVVKEGFWGHAATVWAVKDRRSGEIVYVREDASPGSGHGFIPTEKATLTNLRMYDTLDEARRGNGREYARLTHMPARTLDDGRNGGLVSYERARRGEQDPNVVPPNWCSTRTKDNLEKAGHSLVPYSGVVPGVVSLAAGATAWYERTFTR